MTDAQQAIEIEATHPDRSYCRLFGGQDNGPMERRCWLLPGHQSRCLTRGEVIAASRNMCKPARPLWERWPLLYDQESNICRVDRLRYVAALTPEQRQMRLERACSFRERGQQ